MLIQGDEEVLYCFIVLDDILVVLCRGSNYAMLHYFNDQRHYLHC